MLAARKSFSIQLPFGVDIVKGSVSIKANTYCQTNMFRSNLLKRFCYISCFIPSCFCQKIFLYSMPFGVDYSEKECVFKMDNYSKFVSKKKTLGLKGCAIHF